ncbi:MAG: aminotransferase class I/II-fold pyridoxal phosphate-dependent enzyme, partial [Tepidisphaeraceae bacterium]
KRAEAGLLRERREVRPIDAVHLEIDGRRYVNFCSNNYLGLTHHPAVIEAIQRAAAEFGAGAGAAGLISGYTSLHAAVESAIAAWKGFEASILLASGYQTNHAAIQTLAAIGKNSPAGARFLVDKLAHASLLDAISGSGIPWRVFPHNGLAKLRRLLAEADASQLQIVVTESIFSMDGDAADLIRLLRLKQDHPFVLLLDEAHASGVYGEGGAGYAAELGVADQIDISVVTFSKSAGGVGGAICCRREFRDAVLNFGRAYIYSTSPAPSAAAGIAAAIDVMRREPQRQKRLRELAKRLREKLAAGGVRLPPGDSPIIPIIIGDDSSALAASAKLAGQGLLVQAVRAPTVARGTSRLRVTLSCEHSDEEVDRLTEALLKFNPP